MLAADFGAASVGLFDAALDLRSRIGAAAFFGGAGLAGFAVDERFLLAAVGFDFRVMVYAARGVGE
jgi:hypothetical protein